MLISNADELFDREEFSAAPDAGQPYALTVPSGRKGGGGLQVGQTNFLPYICFRRFLIFSKMEIENIWI